MRKNINIGLCGFGAMGKVLSFAVNNLDFYYKEVPFSASAGCLFTTDAGILKNIDNIYGFGYAAKMEAAYRLDKTDVWEKVERK